MGEYADDTLRREIKGRHGFDIGERKDTPKRTNGAKAAKESKEEHRALTAERIANSTSTPAKKRVMCPHCNKHPLAGGLSAHARDAHGIVMVEPAAVQPPVGAPAAPALAPVRARPRIR